MTRLNFGCGHRFAPGWVNVDFHPEHPEVRRVNLLGRLPFPDDYFDAAYSSHVLEHFTRERAQAILKECYRVLERGGILRTVLPDLEATCREYLRVLEQTSTSEIARRQYEWIILELLDQLTRNTASGSMQPFQARLLASHDADMIRYVRSRTDTNPWVIEEERSLRARLSRLTWGKLGTKLLYGYVAGVKRLLPASLRSVIVDDTRIGEKHRWMYDRYGLSRLLQSCGFGEIVFLSADRSQISGFHESGLDVNPDGSPYKAVSLYCEAKKV